MNGRKWIAWVVVGVVAAGIITVLIVRSHRWRPRAISIQGAILRKDSDPRKELPIGNATVTATDGLMTVQTQSDASGYANLEVPRKRVARPDCDFEFSGTPITTLTTSRCIPESVPPRKSSTLPS